MTTMNASFSATPKQPPDFMEGATCLPASSYTGREQFAREIECCFRTGWVSAGATQQVPSAGDILPVEVAGEPLLVTRDTHNRVHVFFNICRHRGLKLVDGELPRKCTGLLSCPYHSWSYALIFIYPNTLLIMAPNWFQLISLAPRGPALTRELLAGYLVGDGMMADAMKEFRAGFSDLLDEINTQDIAILEKLQAGRNTTAAVAAGVPVAPVRLPPGDPESELL